MNENQSYHMTPEEFRQYGKLAIDWIADYYEQVENYPVLSQVKPGEIRAKLPDAYPQQGDDFGSILKDLNHIILPGITHWQSPNFFAYFPANTSGPAILGDLISSGLGVQGMLWATSPSCTELETHVLDWLAEMLGLPDKFKSSSSGGGVIQDSASSAVLCSALAARERATRLMTNELGMQNNLVAYASGQAHSSIEKAIKIAGYGRQNLHILMVDQDYAILPSDLRKKIIEDMAAGLVPAFVAATIGTTSSNAIDPIAEIGSICKEFGIWLHVDAAMAGTAALCPEYRYLLDGLDLADSYCFNPHKWMFTNFDCSCFYVSDRSGLIQTLSILPEYLRNQATESGAVIDYRDWQVSLGRRFRSLKLWFVIRHYGLEGLQYHIRQHINLAQELFGWIKADERFEIMAPAPLNLICFRLKGSNQANERLKNQLNESGELFLTHTLLNGQYTLRLVVGQTSTERRHVEAAWQKIRSAADLVGKLDVTV